MAGLLKVALVGLPNAGKSTLYNALTRSRDALVSEVPGFTRDWHAGCIRFDESQCLLYDTGGIAGKENAFSPLVEKQTLRAIDDADLVLLVTDAHVGLLPAERELAARLRTTGKALWLVVNKSERIEPADALAEFAALGLPQVYAVSARYKRGLEALRDALKDVSATYLAEDLPSGTRVTFVGRPNAGKSTLINCLLSEERMLVSEIPGTTRDSIAVPFSAQGRQFVLVDTAGVRRRAKTKEVTEKISVLKTFESMVLSDVTVLVCDAGEGVANQDVKIAARTLEAGCALVIAFNKMDLLTADARRHLERTADLSLRFLNNVDRCAISALNGKRIDRLLSAVTRCAESLDVSVSTNNCTQILNRAINEHQPPVVAGRRASLNYAHQGGSRPPRFIVYGRRLTSLPDSYRRYLENYFSRELKLIGMPVVVEYRSPASRTPV